MVGSSNVRNWHYADRLLVAIKPGQILVAFGIVFVILGHVGDGTEYREAAFWVGVVLSVVGLGLEVRNARRNAGRR